MSIQGKRFIVTGASHGCGAGIVRGLIAGGASVVATDLDPPGDELLGADGCQGIDFALLDVSDREAVQRCIDDAAARLGGLDGLVNAAGNTLRCRPEDATDAMWDGIFDVHVKGTFYTNQAIYPHLRAAGGGSIVNFGSAAAIRGVRDFSVYGAAKGAVSAWTRNLALEWGQYNIRVNVLAPSMESRLFRQSRAEMTPDELRVFNEHMVRSTPLRGDIGNPEADLAPLVGLLLGDGGDYITGQTLAVDGGLVMLGS